MKRTITAIVTAATLTTAGATGATAMSMEHNMLTGAVYNELTRLGLSTDSMMDLTLGQVGRINACKNSDESENKIKECFAAAVRNK